MEKGGGGQKYEFQILYTPLLTFRFRICLNKLVGGLADQRAVHPGGGGQLQQELASILPATQSDFNKAL